MPHKAISPRPARRPPAPARALLSSSRTLPGNRRGAGPETRSIIISVIDWSCSRLTLPSIVGSEKGWPIFTLNSPLGIATCHGGPVRSVPVIPTGRMGAPDLMAIMAIPGIPCLIPPGLRVPLREYANG